MKHDESDMQKQIFASLDLIVPGLKPELCVRLEEKKKVRNVIVKNTRVVAPFFSTPNGGQRLSRTGGQLKKEGARSGIPDMICPLFGGLAIELKTVTGQTFKNQKEWLRLFETAGWKVAVVRTAQEAIDMCLLHVGIERNGNKFFICKNAERKKVES